MKRISAMLAGTAALLALVAATLSPSARPASSVRPLLAGARPLLAGSAANGRTLAVIGRSCANCHSEQTDWPWYSRIPPASWMIEKDVSAARTKMNLSRWDEYGAERKRQILGSIASSVRNGRMPLARYLMLHPKARLSEEDALLLETWSRAERRRLRQ